MDGTTSRLFQDELKCLDISAIEQKFGVKTRWGNYSYNPDDGTATFKLDVGSIVDGKMKTQEAADFERYASLHGLQPTDLGRVFILGKHQYEITGLKPRSRKFPILGRKIGTQTVFKFRPITVKNFITPPKNEPVVEKPKVEDEQPEQNVGLSIGPDW